jgi:hypothetical protein
VAEAAEGSEGLVTDGDQAPQEGRAVSYGPARGPLGRSGAALRAARQVAERLRSDADPDEERHLFKLHEEVGNEVTVKQRLAHLYRQLPKVQCQGKCQEACGPIACSSAEAEIMRRHSGRELSFDARTGRCNYLNEGGRCDVYEVRPLVCRIFGTSEKLPCIWGCKPAAPLMSELQEGQLFALVLAVGGGQPVVSMPDDPVLFEEVHPKELQLQGRTLEYGPYLKPMREDK